jgi:hypothetical protein
METLKDLLVNLNAMVRVVLKIACNIGQGGCARRSLPSPGTTFNKIGANCDLVKSCGGGVSPILGRFVPQADRDAIWSREIRANCDYRI